MSEEEEFLKYKERKSYISATPTGKRINNPLRISLYIFLACAFISSYFDAGIIPGAVDEIKKDLETDDVGFGLIGSIDYLGRILASMVYLILIHENHRKFLMVFACLLQGIVLIFTPFLVYLIENKTALYFTVFTQRILCGISQAYFCIYIPVWIDQFGRPNKRTMLLAICNFGIPFGIIIGYAMALALNSWAFSLLIEGSILSAFGIIIAFYPSLYYDRDYIIQFNEDLEFSHLRSNEGNTQYYKKIIKSLGIIFTEKVFVFASISMGIGYFVTTTYQFWGPDYLKNAINLKEYYTSDKIMLGFAIICIVGPIIGYISGGIIGSILGGYTNKKPCYACIISISIASIFGISIIANDTIYYTVSMATLFFIFMTFGFPLITGIVIDSLPRNIRGDGSSMLCLIYNFLGNMPSTFIYGFISSMTPDKPKIAMLFGNLMALLSLISFIIAAVFRLKRDDEEKLLDELKSLDTMSIYAQSKFIELKKYTSRELS